MFWHRRNLSVEDNLGLADAATVETDSGAVVPVFCFDDEVLQHASSSRVAFMLDALDALREHYRERESDLLVRHSDSYSVFTYFWKKWNDREKRDAVPAPDSDALAKYVKRYVPELRDADTEAIHSWPELTAEERDSVAPEYRNRSRITRNAERTRLLRSSRPVASELPPHSHVSILS